MGRMGVFAAKVERLLQRANSWFQEGDYATARQDYATILDADPQHILAQVGLAATLLRTGVTNEAIDKLNDALFIDPECEWAYVGPGSLSGPTFLRHRCCFGLAEVLGEPVEHPLHMIVEVGDRARSRSPVSAPRVLHPYGFLIQAYRIRPFCTVNVGRHCTF